MKYRYFKLVYLMVFSLLITCAVFANDSVGKITGVYSDMDYNSEGGDLIGIEVNVIYSSEGYFVVFQASEGAPSVPVVIKATVSGENIDFVIPDRGAVYSGKFHGVIKKDGMKGNVEGYTGYASKLWLKRQLSYWQRKN